MIFNLKEIEILKFTMHITYIHHEFGFFLLSPTYLKLQITKFSQRSLHLKYNNTSTVSMKIVINTNE